jgi:AcrR family transcriptional regulator
VVTSKQFRRTGRRPGDSGSREAILDAARGRFTAHGYAGATIRGIAADAGVDPALVHHFFGTKDKLFAATMRLPLNPVEVIPQLLEAGIDGAGERLCRLFVRIMRELGDANPMLGLLRSATAHPDAARMLREFFTGAVLERVAAALDVPQPRLRAALCSSQLMGLLVAHQVVGLTPLVEADEEALVAAVGPVLQHYMTDPLPGDA